MNAIVGEDKCVTIRTVPTFEELCSRVSLSEDGSSVSAPFGNGKIAAISEQNLADFSALLLVRNDSVGSKYHVSGGSAIGVQDIAEALNVRVSDESEKVKKSKNLGPSKYLFSV